MTILDRYIIRFFIIFFALSLSICLFIVLIIPFVEELDEIIANRVPLNVMVAYLLYSMPTVFIQVIPMAVLLAILLALISLSRHQELLAMQSNGISLNRLMFFLVLVVCGIALFTWAVEENLAPETLQQAKLIKTYQISKKPMVPYLQEEQMWIRSDPHMLVSLGFVNRTGTQLYQVTILNLSSDETKISRRLEASELQWDSKNGWNAVSGLDRHFNDIGELVSESSVANLPVSFPMRPQDLRQFARQSEEFNTSQLKQYVDLVRKSGLDVKEYLVDYYLKYTKFISPIILALLGIAYGTTLTPRTATKRFAIAILLSIGYYLLLFFVRNLARSGVVPAIVSAGLVPAVFLVWAIWRIHRNNYG